MTCKLSITSQNVGSISFRKLTSVIAHITPHVACVLTYKQHHISLTCLALMPCWKSKFEWFRATAMLYCSMPDAVWTTVVCFSKVCYSHTPFVDIECLPGAYCSYQVSWLVGWLRSCDGEAQTKVITRHMFLHFTREGRLMKTTARSIPGRFWSCMKRKSKGDEGHSVKT